MWKYLRALFVTGLGISSVLADCSLSHKEVWQCIVGDNCVNSVHLHQRTKPLTNSYRLKRPYILAVEGNHYHRLFADCDANKDGCIDMADVMASSACQRSCIWRQTMHDLAC